MRGLVRFVGHCGSIGRTADKTAASRSTGCERRMVSLAERDMLGLFVLAVRGRTGCTAIEAHVLSARSPQWRAPV
uniref:Uncharacterized protein n=1 Tax=Plectus sambesii TaxID=2011161 RepID=A0A914VWD3_9BILA